MAYKACVLFHIYLSVTYSLPNSRLTNRNAGVTGPNIPPAGLYLCDPHDLTTPSPKSGGRDPPTPRIDVYDCNYAIHEASTLALQLTETMSTEPYGA